MGAIKLIKIRFGALLVGLQPGTGTMKNSIALPQKIKNIITT